MTRMRWGVVMLMLLRVTTAPSWADVECTNENTAVPATTPTAEFSLHDNGTAIHARTGLMWMRCSLGQTWTGSSCIGSGSVFTWRPALNAAQNFNTTGGFAGYTDWRLPNKNELESIVEERCWNPAINAAVFLNTPSAWYWSSSPSAGDSYSAWYVNFHYGQVYWRRKGGGNSYRVRLVRGGP